MKVLITGGAGFIGGHLASALAEEGIAVDVLDNFQRGVSDSFLERLGKLPNVRLLNADVTSAESLDALGDDYTHIYHLAAIIGVRHVLERPFEVLAENTRMTLNVIALGRRQKALQRILFTSTSEVYAGSLLYLDMPIPTPESTPIALTDLTHPRTSYMLSKLYGEALFNHCGLPATSVRLHNVYGPRMGMSHVIPELLFKCWQRKDGDTLEVFNPDHRRTFCYVDDAIRMIRAAAETPAAAGRTLNVGNQGPEISIGELAATVIATVGHRLEAAGKDASLGSPSRRCPHMGLMREITGVEGHVSLQEGVAKTYAWYKSNVFEQSGVTAI